MKRIVHCKRHRRSVYHHTNFSRKDKSPSRKRHSNLPRMKKRTSETIYRSPNRLQTNIDIGKNQKNLLRLSLPVLIPQRIQ
jgi:hypothetical protein